MPQPAPERGLFDVIRMLSQRPSLTQRELAASLGMSLGKANYCLKALVAKGFVKAENYRRSDNKLAYFYILTPAGIAAKAELTRNFLARKVAEYEALRLEIEQLARDSDLQASVPLERVESGAELPGSGSLPAGEIE